MPAQALTKIDIAALKKCDDIVFRRRDGRDTVEAIKRKPEATASNPFPQEHIHIIEVGSYLRNYRKEPAPGDAWTAFDMLHGRNPCAETAISAMRPGDTLQINWTAGNDTQTMTDAGFSTDELALVILRNGKAVGCYLLAYSTQETGSRFRMIRF